MKSLKFHRTIVAIAMMLIGWLPSLAHDFEVNGIFYDKLNSSKVAVTYKGDYYSYSNEYAGDVVIPSSVNYNGRTYRVTSIGDEAFYDCDSLTSIEIPNSVTSIGQSAFAYCKSLTGIQIPNSVTSIGDYAFSHCYSLTSIAVDADNTKYDSRNGCNAIIETASNTLIAGCQNTIIPNSVTSIGVWAFGYCESLTSIEIPNSVTSIGYGAFSNCSSLTSIEIPNSVTWIGGGAFAYCKNLTSVVWNVKKCSDFNSSSRPFGNSPNITSFTFGNSVEYIPDYLCYEMFYLTNVVIPNSVTSIGKSAFEGCESLTSIEIPNSVTSIGDYAFYRCSKLPSIQIPNSVTSIGDYAFYYCESLTSIEIPNSVTSIGKSAFEGCESLTSIVVDAGNTKYDSRNGCNAIIETASNTLVAGCQNTIIPDSVTSIGDVAFLGCTSLTSIEIPNSVTSIGWGAFANCTSLTEITCWVTTPPTIYFNTFSNYYADLYVPVGCKSVYKSAEYWENFNYINDTLNNPITLNDNDVIVATVDDYIVVKNAKLGSIVNVYASNGALVASEEATDRSVVVEAPVKGVYVVKVGKQTVKVII